MSDARPLKVLYTTHESNLTGASRSLIDLVGALDRHDVDAVVLLRGHGPLEEELGKMGITYKIIPYAPSVRGSQSKYPNWVMSAANALAVRRIASYLKEGGFDLVHSNSLLADVGMRAARQDEIPYVCHVRDLVAEDHGLVFCDEFRTRSLMADASMNIFISDFVANKFKGWVGGSPWKVLYDAVDLDGKNERRLPPFVGKGPLRVLLPGRFQPTKGQLDAIEAAELVHGLGIPIQLTLIGGIGYPEYYEECRGYIESHGLDYIHVEPFSDDIAREYALTDITLMCSKAEAMGRVTVEGMLAESLVIGANAGATPEIIDNGVTGVLYEVGQPVKLAEKIAWAGRNKEAARRIAEGGRSWATKRFDRLAYRDAILEIYQDVFRKAKLTRPSTLENEHE